LADDGDSASVERVANVVTAVSGAAWTSDEDVARTNLAAIRGNPVDGDLGITENLVLAEIRKQIN
jgi:hypothetical protein